MTEPGRGSSREPSAGADPGSATNPGASPGAGPGAESGAESAADAAARVASVRRDAVKGKRRLTSSVLAMEVIVFWLAIIVAIVSSGVAAAVAVPVGVALALACIVVAARITRPWAYRAGAAVQVLAVACGFAVHTMFVVGALFAVLWVAAVRIGDSAIRVAEQYAASVRPKQ